jgi:hypothetical protein
MSCYCYTPANVNEPLMYFFLFQDDFYLNLVDWSQQNILSVGLGTCVYLWSACTSQVRNKRIYEISEFVFVYNDNYSCSFLNTSI